MPSLTERIHKGKEAVAQARAEGKDVAAWERHLARLEALVVLDELRPHLPPALRSLPDDKLLALADWAIICAWQRALEKAAK